MSGFSWISVIALACYLLLFITFLAASKTKKVIRTFMFFLFIMILWVGGSFAMRSQFWPSTRVWNQVSLAGIMFLPYAYFCVVIDFLEEKKHYGRNVWLVLMLICYVINFFTGIFIPDPRVVSVGTSVQFLYDYNWLVAIPLALGGLVLLESIFLFVRYCRGDTTTGQQLLPVIIGAAIMVACHILSAFSIFKGFPLDIISGVINAFILFYALYKKRLFRMTLLVSRWNCYAVALLISIVAFSRCIVPIQEFLARAVHISESTSIIVISIGMMLATYLLYLAMKRFMDELFIKEEAMLDDRLREFSEAVSRTLDMDDILQEMADVIRRSIGIQHMFFCIKNDQGIYQIEHTGSPLDEKDFQLDASHPLLTYIRGVDGCLMMEDFRRTTAYKAMWEGEKRQLRIWEVECLSAFKAEHDLIGLVMFSSKPQHKPFTNEDINFIQSVSSVCAMAVKNARLYQQAYEEARKDELTGLINRKYFYEILQREFDQSGGTSLALAILNVDDFKLYNQLYGNKEGDVVLQRVAEIIRAMIADRGYGARISGKEFGIILPGYDIYSAKVLAESILSQVKEINRSQENYSLKMVTMSGGVCAAPYMASSPKELVENADMAVYRVKRTGKNAVIMYSEDIEKRSSEGAEKHRSSYNEYASTIYALTATIDTKDHYTFNHSQNVAYYASELARACGMNQDYVEIVKEAGLLHDIGKIGINEEILNKPGRLTPDEYEIMKSHVENSIGIIRYLPSLDYVIPAVISHHERYDGQGYPRKLSGEDIPVMGRILCIADSFDAMVSERSYKRAMAVDRAVEILWREAGRQFDPNLVPVFVELVRSGKLEVRAPDYAKNLPPATEPQASVPDPHI